MGNTSSTSLPTYHDPSESDVFDLRDMMATKLPVELVDIILNEAEYWPVIATECPTRGLRTSSYETAKCCIISPQIPHSSQPLSKKFVPGGNQDVVVESDDNAPSLRRKVKRVEFQLTSCDQGWGGEHGLKYPYAGAWSWFDAEIWRPDGITPSHSIIPYRPLDPLPSNEQLQSTGYRRVEPLPEATDGDKSAATWLVQRNRRADSRVRQHFVIWTDSDLVDHSVMIMEPDTDNDSDSDDNHSESSENQDTPEAMNTSNVSLADLHGCGNGFGFVRSLQPGDRIVLVVQARYPGWENYIRGTVSLKVHYTVIG